MAQAQIHFYGLCHIYKGCFSISAARLLEEKLDLNVGSTVTGIDYLESPVSDGTIEENFEEALVDAPIIETGTRPFSQLSIIPTKGHDIQDGF